ncbi:Rne/Rng family ribonuclease [Actinoallomurus rhizosphaericola]|uniref:Rne/Rng family ribonuclease n=1 Tax=Actinoallomurus rhizosphaericola TaxID=2952536 RepID=UPI002090AFDF|nr:Rne/Rng family ribonuclease [Actinoallomurus rhizosphaericola]MCO5993871.1 Rne/Rng family ribonuclease [Actinoallomurus rhizosphaericola]
MLDKEFGDATGGTADNGPEAGEQPKKTTRPRRASRPAGPPPEPEEDTTPRPVTRPAAAASAEAVTSAAPPAAESDAATGGAPGDAATSAPGGDAPSAKGEDAPSAASASKPARTRRTRKAASAAPEPAPEPAAQTEQTTPSAPEPSAPAGAATRPAGPPPAVPEAAFQPPMVIFQPPQLPDEEQAAPRSRSRAEAQPKAEKAEKAKTETKVETPPAPEEPEDEQDEDEDGTDRSGRRRRRRGGRGRGKARDGQEAEETGRGEDEPEAEAGSKQAEEEPEQDAADDEQGEGGGTRRRRRRRRRSVGADTEDISPDDPPNTVVHVREPRVVEDEVQAVKGSTRLEAKKQRRREGREQGRRRPPIVTESEFLARRESVERIMVIRSEGDRTQIGVLEDKVLVEHYVDRSSHQSYIGNVYLGKVQNVLPSMEAAFVDIGKGRNAVLYAGEVNWDLAGLEGQPRRIESALKSGQSVLVQVTKDPVGHKGARLTSQISLPGRYLVYVPDGSMTGISRKLPDKERSRLKQILKKVMPENAGVIVRTAAEGATEDELSRDVSRLAAQWENIKRQSKTASAPAMLYGEPDLTIRVVRDIFNEDFTKLVVQGEDAWDMVEEYVGYVAPHLADRLHKWTDDEDVFTSYRIDEQMAKALDRKVWLPSGGSLVIDRTEAMTVVDVNTGKFTGQGGNLEETVTRNNLEAAEEIVHQLRLRDIGGIIVIDFIDMVLESNRELVLRRMLECLSRDRTKHQVAEVTSLGLVQMTRKRVGGGLLESFSEPCDCCNGRGIHVTLSPVEPKADKSAAPSRRKKRKGEVEKAVEDKLARAERRAARADARAAEAEKAAAESEAATAGAGEPAEAVSGPVEGDQGAAEARPAEAAETAPAAAEEAGHEALEAEPSTNGRRRRTRRSPRARSEAAAE